MKILYISDHGPYSSTFIRQDVEAISNLQETLYISFEADKKYPDQKTKTKLIRYPSHSIKSKIRWRLENLFVYFNWHDKLFSISIKEEIDAFDPEVIHCQFAYESAKLLHNFDTNKPIVINFRGYGASYKLKNVFYVKWLRKTLQRNNVFPIFVSKSLRKNLLKEKIIPKNEGMVLYTGIDLKKFTRTNYKISSHPVFVQVSNFNDKKGQQITIQAFKKAIAENPTLNAKLIFIGDGKNLNVCKKLVDELNLNDRIEFLGNLDHFEIIKCLNFATIFVHHSITAPNGDQEGIPNVIIEAMAMELPILSTFHSGIPEAVEHQINGLLCMENDIETYSKQMQEISNWGLLKINRTKVFEQFNIENHIEKLNRFYHLIRGN